MAERTWETGKLCYCERIQRQVTLETELLYPIDYLPDPPRILSHRCSHGVHCNLFSTPSCVWAGTNPAYDPFRP